MIESYYRSGERDLLRRIFPEIMLILMLIGSSAFTIKVQPVKAWTGTVYIRADGSIDPGDAPIQRDGGIYTLTGNITSGGDGIVVQRDNIVIDGTGHTVQGTEAQRSRGIDLWNRHNVIITNLEIKMYGYGIWFEQSYENAISRNRITYNYRGISLNDAAFNTINENEITNNGQGINNLGEWWAASNQITENNITNNGEGISLGYAGNNIISENNIAANSANGIRLFSSQHGWFYNSYNRIFRNNITANGCGVTLMTVGNDPTVPFCTYSNRIYENRIVSNGLGVCLNDVYLNNSYGDTSNCIFHNNFDNNTQQVHASTLGSACILDDGYPSGGNYWSDYNETDLYNGDYQNETGSDGKGDIPHVIDANNRDNYPLVKPWKPFEHGTIYIQADGSVDPSGAPIQREGDIYTLTDNIVSITNGIVIERNNLTLDGAGYTLQGSETGTGIAYGRENMTVQNIQIKAFYFGIWVGSSSNNNIIGTNITENTDGIRLYSSSNYNRISGNNIKENHLHGIVLNSSSKYNSITENNIENNWEDGIWLDESDNNNISGNNITKNYYVMWLGYSSNNNSISGNNIENNFDGICLYLSSNNSIYHNNFIDNTRHVYDYSWDYPELPPSINTWDDGYPSGGNYWSDYNGTNMFSGFHQNEMGMDFIGDTAYSIDANNRDRYPLIKPYGVAHDLGITNATASKTIVAEGYSMNVNVTIANYGTANETFTLAVWADSPTHKYLQLIEVTLTARNFTTVTVTWSTLGFTKANYTHYVEIYQVPGETDVSDNSLIDSWMIVTIPGDANGDFKVDGKDIAIIAKAFNTEPGQWLWNPAADIDNDLKVDGKDIAIAAKYYSAHYP